MNYIPVYECEVCHYHFSARMGNKTAAHKNRFCSRKHFGIYCKEHITNPVLLLNRIQFHPERLTSLANIIELDAPGELAEILATRDLFASVEFAFFSNRGDYPRLNNLAVHTAEGLPYSGKYRSKISMYSRPLADYYRLTDEQQSTFLSLFTNDWKIMQLPIAPLTPMFSPLHMAAGITATVRTTDEDLPKGGCYLFFDKPVSGVELSKGERIQLAALLLKDIDLKEERKDTEHPCLTDKVLNLTCSSKM